MSSETNNGRTVLVTGASSGIGKAAAELLLRNGFTVYGAARRLDSMKDLEASGLIPVFLDVTDHKSCSDCINKLTADGRSPDILINAAGYGSFGSFEEVSDEEAKRQFEVNVFGLAALTRLVLPSMREKGSGLIINLSSMAGQIYSPMGTWYYASKRALEAVSDCLRCEAEPFGINVVLIEPGMIMSEWSKIAVDSMKKTSASGPYAKICDRMAKLLSFGYQDGIAGTPEYIAELILKAVKAKKPKMRYAGPLDAKVLLFFKKYTPDFLFDTAVRLICMPRSME